MTPSLTVLITGRPGAPATARTERSVRHARFDGELDVIVGDDEGPAVRATGEFLLVLPAGAILDGGCLGHLVERATQDRNVAAVLPEIRGRNGRPLPTGMHVEWAGLDHPAAHHSGAAHRAHHPVDVTASTIMLMRTAAFLSAGGFPGRADSPFRAAVLAVRLMGRHDDVVVEDRAVVYTPPLPEHPARRPGYELFTALGPDGRSGARPEAVLWVTPHLPDRTRTGAEARHLEMIEATAAGGADVVVWAERGGDTGPSGDQLAAAGAHWETPLPSRRWDTAPATAPWHLLDDLLAERAWSTVIVAEPRLVAPVSPRVDTLAPEAAVIADLGTIRFPAAHSPADKASPADPATASTLAALRGAHAVVTASEADARVIRSDDPARDVFVFATRGLETGGGASRSGHVLFVGDFLHHPNVQALEWWGEELAGLVFSRAGRPIPLRVVGTGSDALRPEWRRPDKLDIAGRRPDLGAELRAARLLAVPLPYPTGTGHRIATALRTGVPVAASAAAAAVLPSHLAGLVSVGEDAGELAGHIARLATDDDAWEAARSRIADAVSDRRHPGGWDAWWRRQRPPGEKPVPTGTGPGRRRFSWKPGSPPAPRRPGRSS